MLPPLFSKGLKSYRQVETPSGTLSPITLGAVESTGDGGGDSLEILVEEALELDQMERQPVKLEDISNTKGNKS
jgi:hypothetical protein